MKSCHGCGKKLIGEWISEEVAKLLKLDTSKALKSRVRNKGSRFEHRVYFFGDYGRSGNNLFCSLSCGYYWAVSYLSGGRNAK